MGRGSRGGGYQPFRRQADLTGVITAVEKNEVNVLVCAITEKMHDDISVNFDSRSASPLPDEQGGHHQLSLAIYHRQGENKEDKAPEPISSPSKTAGAQSKSYARAHETLEREERETMTPHLRELRKEAIDSFRKWQGEIIRRTREMFVREAPGPQNAFRGRGGRAQRGGSRGNTARGGAITGRSSRGPFDDSPSSFQKPLVNSSPRDRKLAALFPPIPTTLSAGDEEKRRTLLQVLMLLTLSLKEYNANSRIFLLHLASSLDLTREWYQREELRVSQILAKAALQSLENAETGKKPEESRNHRSWKASLGNSLGHNDSLTGRLKPDNVARVRNCFGLPARAVTGLLGPMSEPGSPLGNLFGINANRPIEKMLESFCREIPDFAFLRLNENGRAEYRNATDTPAEDRRLHLTVAVSGCLSTENDVAEPWRCLGHEAETYEMRWDVDSLTKLGAALQTVIKSTAWASAKKEITSRSVHPSLFTSSWPISLLKVSKIIDNPWSIGMVRAEKAGSILADAIARHKFQGERSVSLIGYGLASRAIYTCLMLLAERRQFGLVDSVVMMGAPAPSESRVWLTLKSVVSGRLINVYSEKDFILDFLYRTSNTHFGVAGLQKIQNAPAVENYCVKDLPRGHLSYQDLAGDILREINWEGLKAKAATGPQVTKPRANRGQRKPPVRRAKSAK
ncbi:hypothetical protein HIM_00265 [Hirsutella minnesotensis 3608]|nr:hypothetical protein HIM_00265 [Hirsutella minnesotensis 3608]